MFHVDKLILSCYILLIFIAKIVRYNTKYLYKTKMCEGTFGVHFSIFITFSILKNYPVKMEILTLLLEVIMQLFVLGMGVTTHNY